MRISLTTICASAFLLFAPPGAAYPQQQTPSPMQQQQPEIDVDQDELETFVDIYVSVQERRAKAQSEMAGAESPEQAQAVQQTAEQELAAIIEDHGWTVEHYNTVANVINNDLELRQQAIQMINERS